MGDSTTPTAAPCESDDSAQPGYALSSYPHILEQIVYYADNKTRVTLLRTTSQLHWMVGPLVYREVYIDKRTLAGVFLGWDVEGSEFQKAVLTENEVERLQDTRGGEGARNGVKRGGRFGKLVKGLLAGIRKGQGVDKAQGGKGEAQSRMETKSKTKGREGPHVATNFKAPLLRLVKVVTITEHHPDHCQHLADTAAAALISLDVLRIVPPKYDHLTSFKQLCKGHRSCPLLGCLDTKKIVFRNVNGSGLPIHQADLRSWSPPSLQEVVCFLATDGSLASHRQSGGLFVEMAGMFQNVKKIKLVFFKHGEEPTPTDRPYPKRDGMTMDQLGTLDPSTFIRFLSGQGVDRDIPTLHASDFIRIVTGVQREGRAVEIFGMEKVPFDSFHPPQPYETDDAASQNVVTRVCEALRKANTTIEGNSEENLVIGSIDEYWAQGDWFGEVNDKEITQRIRSRQWARWEARRDARWMTVRDELHMEYKAGNFQCDSWPAKESLREQFEAGELEDDVWPPEREDFEETEAPYWFYRNDSDDMDKDDEVTF
ncbi:hypothetical protein JCM24511_08217 [Saitozyma sp. JCM 24511]|nr:hypothetical protein JCM24511_08217 [Saitozyma sp. JCM 24511]